MDKELKDCLQKFANQKLVTENMSDNDCIYDWCAGNVDDAYEMGVEDGEIQLARDLLNRFNKE